MLACVALPETRQDFLAGERGTVALSESELDALQALSALVLVDRPNLTMSFADAAAAQALHLQMLLEARNKEAARGCTYRELRELVRYDWISLSSGHS